MKTPDKLQWLFGPTIDVKEIVITVAAVLIILAALSGCAKPGMTQDVFPHHEPSK